LILLIQIFGNGRWIIKDTKYVKKEKFWKNYYAMVFFDFWRTWPCDFRLVSSWRVTNKRKKIQSPYYIHGQQLISADTAKYLGVHLKNNLNWTDHIKTVTKKARGVSAFLQRNIRPCPRKTKALCYLIWFDLFISVVKIHTNTL